MHSRHLRIAVKLALLWLASLGIGLAADVPSPSPVQKGEEVQVGLASPGHRGGTLVVAQRAEPKTLNPVLAFDTPSRDVIGRMMADLIHINRVSEKTEPALATAWKISPDGRHFILKLRRGVRFSDGQLFDADDVIFTFKVYLDEKVHSPQRDLLVINGKPLSVTKIDSYTVRFDLDQPYAAGERIFDSLAILPRHLLETAYNEGKFSESWTLNVAPGAIAGLGPFRLKEYVPGQRIVLERNPYYWKVDHDRNRLPYLDELVFLFVGTEDAQVIHFESGESQIINRFGTENFRILAKEQYARGYHVEDLGPSLEFNFLFFNLNHLSPQLSNLGHEQTWFRDLKFRQAVSFAIDRDAIVRLAYQGHGAALWGNESPSDKLWINQSLPHPQKSVEHARDLLKSADFSWNSEGKLLDREGTPVEFTIITSSSNGQRVKMATLIADDLAQLGMNVHPIPLEFRAVVDRVFQSNDYEACILGLGGGDADPNVAMNVWLSNGPTHVWNLHETRPATEWEAEIDRLMNQQMITMDYRRRKQIYDRVQQLIADNLPVIFLATPDILVGANNDIGNFNPGILEPYALWNTEELFIQRENVANRQ